MSRGTLTGGADRRWVGVSAEVQAVKRCCANRDVEHRHPELAGRCSYRVKVYVDGRGYCSVHAAKAKAASRGS